MSDAEAIDRRAAALYGEVEWREARGVLHVAAIVESIWSVIAIGPGAPASRWDRFALGLARARADVVVTTGAVLRAEPALVHRFAELPREDAAFAEWRRCRLGRSRRPSLVVLSHSGRFPVEHPALRAAVGGFVWTSAEGRARLGPRIGALETLVGAEQGVVAAVEHALAEPGRETLLVEAGPRAARALYPDAGVGGARRDVAAADGASPQRVDELLLSCFEGPAAQEAIGPDFVARESIGSAFADPPSAVRLVESGGSWRFLRYRRSTSPVHPPG
jgi:hypothetical protein